MAICAYQVLQKHCVCRQCLAKCCTSAGPAFGTTRATGLVRLDPLCSFKFNADLGRGLDSRHRNSGGRDEAEGAAKRTSKGLIGDAEPAPGLYCPGYKITDIVTTTHINLV